MLPYKNVLLLLFIAVICMEANAQSAANTYAVVVGISNYKEASIPALQYADKDARYFAEFLRSKSGGNTPTENIILLQNEQATVGTIYQALTHLLEVVKSNDLVYFYFSGHGDVENKVVSNLGYLLAYNSPTNNYINHAIRLEDINDIANTLSAERNAKVVLITDACRSGKLAGDDMEGRSGKQLVAEQLLKTQQNEVRLTACGPDQLSVENEAWGGGRGVFSYYLIRGLYGFAGNDSMPIVTSGEMKNYLAIALASDPVLLQENHQQVPVLQGSDSITLSNKDSTLMANLKEDMTNKRSLPGSLSKLPDLKGKRNILPLEYFFSLIKPVDLVTKFNVSTMKDMLPEEIPYRLINGIIPTMNDAGYDSLKQLTKLLKANKSLINRFNDKLVSMITDMGQQLVIGYCNGNESELEKRTFYGQVNNYYENYVDLYDIALKIIPNTHFLYRPLLVDQLYFSGIIQRLKMPAVFDPSDLLAKAITFQHKALALEPYAPYINNELGVLYTEIKIYDSAFYYYHKATELSPGWAVPWANLIGYYNTTGNLQKAKEAADKARAIQPDLYILLSNEGVTAELEKNWLRAEELQLKNIRVNDQSYFPYDRLGHIYLNTCRFQLAEDNFRESALKKQNLFFTSQAIPGIMGFRNLTPPEIPEIADSKSCLSYTADTVFNNPYYDLLATQKLLEKGDSANAALRFQKLLNTGADSIYLVNHYYGKWLYSQNRLAEAEWFLKKAKNRQIDSLRHYKNINNLPFDSSSASLIHCLNQKVLQLFYHPQEDDYLLAENYKQLGYINLAVELYQTLIKDDTLSPWFPAPYFLLTDLLIEYKQYQDAETVWMQYKNTAVNYLNNNAHTNDPLHKILSISLGEFELENFYLEMSAREPQSSYWNDRSARFWYAKIVNNPHGYLYQDSILELENLGLPAWQINNSIMNYQTAVRNLDLIPAIQKSIPFKSPVSFPLKRSFATLKTALIYGEKSNKKTYANNLGELFQLNGNYKKAQELFLYALSLSPDENSQRKKLIQVYLKELEYTKAFEQMNSLFIENHLLLEDLEQYTQMALYKNDSTLAKNALVLAKNSFLWDEAKINSLFGKFFYIHQNWDLALPYFLDSATIDVNYPERLYLVASIYMKKGDLAEAKIWLQKSVSAGFNYQNILKEDKIWSPLHSELYWETLLEGLTRN